MIRTLLRWTLFLVLAIVLIGVDRRLERKEELARDPSHRIGRLIPEKERSRLTVAGIRVVPAGGSAELYWREGEVWRCKTCFDAVASEEAVSGLLRSLLEGEGVVTSRDPSRAGVYGIGKETSWRVQLLGPTQATEVEVELGARLPDAGGCYVRRADHPAVWALDTDPWEPLGIDPEGLRPPLLDLHVIPRIWPGKSRRVDRILLERVGEPPLELTMEEIKITEEEMRKGKSPYIWHLKIGAEETPANDRNAMAFSGYLLRIPFVRVLDPARARDLGLDAARTRLTLFPFEGKPAELLLCQRLPSGNLVVLNQETGSLFEVTPETAALTFPGPQALLENEEANPWGGQAGR